MASSFLRKLVAFREAILRPNTPQMEEDNLSGPFAVGAFIGGALFGFFFNHWLFKPHLGRLQKVLEEHEKGSARTAVGKDA